ncbi:hypothetical protein BJY01DRAFT_206533 [Aspergillus pseudoustus]|uniref:Uncharacterized protein n=1 Tax=Aspergillus pseudoustus TaxID=1810923 RepID=A0ABR4KQ72_9EURO
MEAAVHEIPAHLLGPDVGLPPLRLSLGFSACSFSGSWFPLAFEGLWGRYTAVVVVVVVIVIVVVTVVIAIVVRIVDTCRQRGRRRLTALSYPARIPNQLSTIPQNPSRGFRLGRLVFRDGVIAGAAPVACGGSGGVHAEACVGAPVQTLQF